MGRDDIRFAYAANAEGVTRVTDFDNDRLNHGQIESYGHAVVEKTRIHHAPIASPKAHSVRWMQF